MDRERIIRRVRAIVGNAVVWGAAWATLGLAVFAGFKVASVLPANVNWLDALVVAGRAGVMGGIAGTAFSAAVGLVYRGKRLSQISWVRFGMGGAVLTGLFVPVFMQTMNLLSGDGFVPMRFVLDDVPWTAVFGGAVAAASLRLAQRAEPRLSGGSEDRPGLLARGNPLTSVGERGRRPHEAPAWRGADG